MLGQVLILFSVVKIRRCYVVLDRVFCQAEDGIGDLVRSRGLGDVYKRQDRRTINVEIHPVNLM